MLSVSKHAYIYIYYAHIKYIVPGAVKDYWYSYTYVVPSLNTTPPHPLMIKKNMIYTYVQEAISCSYIYC